LRTAGSINAPRIEENTSCCQRVLSSDPPLCSPHFNWALSKVSRPRFPHAVRWDTGVHERQPQQGCRQARSTETHSGGTDALMTRYSRVESILQQTLLSSPSQPHAALPTSPLSLAFPSRSYLINCLVSLRYRERWAKNCQQAEESHQKSSILSN